MFQTKIKLVFALLAILNISNNKLKVECQEILEPQQPYRMFGQEWNENDTQEERQKKTDEVHRSFLNKIKPIFQGEQKSAEEIKAESRKIMLQSVRPTITWPNQFELTLSTNEFALNITEVIYFDRLNKKLRMQLYYSVMGLEPSKGFDLTIDEDNKQIAVQSEQECKRTDFSQSLIPVNLFFGMFNQFTIYEGEKDDIHYFKLKKFSEKMENMSFEFMFDTNKTYVSSKLTHGNFGDVQVDVLQPVKARSFEDSDFYQNDCEQIESAVLNDSNGWIGFMHQLVSHLFLNGQDIQTYLGLDGLFKNGQDDDDEDFD